jgi:hypothetical protein
MSGYYQANPHYQTRDFSEARERFERCEQEAGTWFAYATKPQTAAFHLAMSDLRGLSGPRYDRARAAALAEFERTTGAAVELCAETVRELMQTGEVSEALAYRWELLAVVNAMLEVA